MKKSRAVLFDFRTMCVSCFCDMVLEASRERGTLKIHLGKTRTQLILTNPLNSCPQCGKLFHRQERYTVDEVLMACMLFNSWAAKADKAILINLKDLKQLKQGAE